MTRRQLPTLFGIEGTIVPSTESDFFSLGTPSPGSRLFALVDGVAGGSTDFDLRVTTSTDTLEYDDLNMTRRSDFGRLTWRVLR